MAEPLPAARPAVACDQPGETKLAMETPMADHLPTEHLDPDPDTMEEIGNHGVDHRAIRLACLIEAREQMGRADLYGYGDLLYRARLNAQFVIDGTTPRLRKRKQAGPQEADV